MQIEVNRYGKPPRVVLQLWYLAGASSISRKKVAYYA
jgi:hypothetical protein